MLHLQAQTVSDSLAKADTTGSNIWDIPQSGWITYLPDGGRIWATEDPASNKPALNVSASQYVGLDNGKILKPITFHIYSNYAKFIDKAKILIYRGQDNSYKRPVAVIPIKKMKLSMDVKWAGQLQPGTNLHQGGALKYIIRAYGAGGKMDETYPRYINLLSLQKIKRRHSPNSTLGNSASSSTFSNNLNERGEQTNRNNNGTYGKNNQNDVSNADDDNLERLIFGNNNLRIQHIPIIGSSIQLHGENLSDDVRQIYINGRSVPVNIDNRFLAEYLMPAGRHAFTIHLKKGGKEIVRRLSVKSSANHFLMVGIADVSLSKNMTHGDTKPIRNSDNFNQGLLGEGRLAFYMKAKLKGKYLITAQADTRQDKLGNMFNGFFDKNPTDLFRRLDPDRYYTVYGDNSHVYRDVNTQGKFYLRMNWNKSRVLWGNYQTRFDDNSLTLFNRGLYGGYLQYNSPSSTNWGASHIHLTSFGSNPETVYSHNEFTSTGGSLYYMHHTDILRGSEQVSIELRDAVTGLAKREIRLRPGVDYEIDFMQGRIILKKPIPQMALKKNFGVIRDRPEGNLKYVLLVDYEYIPIGLKLKNTTIGGQGHVWLGNHVGIGGTYVNEGRGTAEAYRLYGGDFTLRGGNNTFVKVEIAESKQTQAPVFFSYNGGLTFTKTIPNASADLRSGGAFSVLGRANFATLFAVSDSSYFSYHPWNIGAWYKDYDGGFSIARRDYGYDRREIGGDLDAEISNKVRLHGEVSKRMLTPIATTSSTVMPSATGNQLTQGKIVGLYRINNYNKVTAEVRGVRESQIGTQQGEAVLGGARYQLNLKNGLEFYAVGQTAMWADNHYRDNKRATLGSQFMWGRNTTMGAEYSLGSRGDIFNVSASHNFSRNYQVYTRYGWSPDYNSNALFGPNDIGGLTVGQRWRATQKLNVFEESNLVRSGAQAGLVHSLGLNYVPAEFWRLGLRVQGGSLDTQVGNIDRYSATFTVGKRQRKTDWSSKFEYRGDYGARDEVQLITTQRIRHKFNESWRVAGRLNFANTNGGSNFRDARFIESNLGVSYRPWNSSRWAVLSKFTYLYDRQSVGQLASGQGRPNENVMQLTGSSYDQKSVVGALELINKPVKRLELSLKGALRVGDIRDRATQNAQWYKSATEFLALQVRYRVWHKWDALAEGRLRRNIQANDTQSGFLVGIGRRITDFLKIGAGYNFTDFSDRLTDLDYNDRGWFINLVGFY